MPHRPQLLCLRRPPTLPCSRSRHALGRTPLCVPLYPSTLRAEPPPDPQRRSSALPCPAATFLQGPLIIFFSRQ